MTVRLRRLTFAIALAFLAAHAVRLPQTLEDIDSINFAMGVERFDVAQHRPHPPGYPVFVVVAKLSTAAVSALGSGWDRDQAATAGLALLSVIAGALSVPMFAGFWLAVGLSPTGALLAAVLAGAAPLFWLTASRPLTDMPGLVAAVAVQTLLIRGISAIRERETFLSRPALGGALGAGFVIGIRSQTLWLTGPLAVWLFGLLLWRRRFGHAIQFIAAAAVGALLWAVPLVYATGGLAAYLSALGGQGQEDFAGVQMLATAPTWSLFQSAISRTFIAPWQVKTLAHVVLVLALCGLGVLAWRGRPMLATVMIAFLPYLVLHLAFQETVTIRYALPVLVPVAGLAVASLETVGVYAAAIGTTSLVVSLALATPRLDLYARDGAPVFRAFRDMHAAWHRSPQRPVLKMHHQVWWGVRRIIDWYRPVWNVGPQPFPGDREWLDVVDHFRSGQPRPVWFLAHVSRPVLPMFDARAIHRSRRYQFPRDLQTLIGGARLDSVIWHSVRPPGWMLARGWSLTPELAGATAQDREASRIAATEAFLRRRAGPQRLLIGGRYLGPDDGPPVDLTVLIDERPVVQLRATANPRWFFQWVELPNGTATGHGAYARLVVNTRTPQGTDAGALIGLEQFDVAPADDSMFAYATGWYESEANPATGLTWRWTSAASSVEIRGKNQDRRLVISGESPLRYLDRAPQVTVRAGERVLGTFSPSADFVETIALPSDAVAAASGRVTIQTNLTFSPNETGSPDRRVLGLRLFSVTIR